MSEMLTKALECLGRGWSIIPAKAKKPIVEWGKYMEHPPTEDEVRAWWKANPNAQIALITGRVSGLVVVDIDTDRGGDPRKVFDTYKTDLISRTGKGGFHLFYHYPHHVERVANRVGKDGIDVRADGGYVVLPPSTHENGKKYAFVREGEPGECPPWLYQAPVEAEKTQAEQKWLSELLGGLQEGGRNDACARLAGYFAEKGMAREVALALCQQWNEKNSPPLPVSEVETTVRSVYKKAFLKLKEQGLVVDKKAAPATFNVVTMSSYMARYGDAAVQWAIEDWMPVNTVAFVVSPPGSYKTWFVLDLAVSLASGKPFLGQYPVLSQPGPVLVIQQEDYHGQVAERLATIIAGKYDLTWQFDVESEEFLTPNPPELPIHFHPDRMLRFENKAVLDKLEEQIARIRPKLVILDPLYSAGSTEDYMAKTAEQMFVFKRWRDKYDCSFLVVHHTKKTTEGSSTREAAWGSQFLNAFLETGWQIRRVAEDPKAVSVQRHFKVKGNPKDLLVEFDIQTEYPSKYTVKTADYDVAASETDGPNILEILEKEGPLSPTEIAEKVNVHRSTISRKAAPLIKAGAIIKRNDGKLALPTAPAI